MERIRLANVCLLIASLLLDNDCMGGSQETCQLYTCTLKCDGNKRRYNCSAPSPVFGDTCTVIATPSKLCENITNVTASNDVKTNWTNLRIFIKISPRIYCNEHNIILNVLCSNQITLTATVKLKPPGVELSIENGTKLTSHVESDLLVLVCNATGLDMEMDMKFIGPNEYNRPCPKSSSAYTFPDGTTTRFDHKCILIIRKLTPTYIGKYHCEVTPLQDVTCHNLTSNIINIVINPDNSISRPDIGVIVGGPVIGGIVLCACVFITILNVCFCYRYIIKRDQAPQGTLSEKEQRRINRKNNRKPRTCTCM